MELQTLKIIITGAGRGMGATFARRLHEAGAAVAAGDVDPAGLAELPEGIARRHLDVSDAGSCREFVAWASEEMGGLNGLINNAGILRDGLLVKKHRETGEVTTLSDADYQAVINVNLNGSVYMTRETVRTMVEADAKPGIVVNLSSVARHGNRGQTNYVATKAAVAANAVSWAREFARFQIRVVAIAPGMVETPMTRSMPAKARDALLARIPCGRIGKPDDIWRAVQFAIECDYFNGRTIDVDGGLVM